MIDTDKKAVDIIIEAIRCLKTDTELKKFLQDALTSSEITELANRLKIVQMLDEKISYETIVAKTGVSSTTVARTQKWLLKGKGGFRILLSRLKQFKNLEEDQDNSK